MSISKKERIESKWSDIVEDIALLVENVSAYRIIRHYSTLSRDLDFEKPLESSICSVVLNGWHLLRIFEREALFSEDEIEEKQNSILKLLSLLDSGWDYETEIIAWLKDATQVEIDKRYEKLVNKLKSIGEKASYDTGFFCGLAATV